MAAVGAALLAALLGGCSSQATTVGQGAAGAPSPGVSRGAIRLGVLATLTGPGAWPGFDVGVRARLARQDRLGGVHGRQLNLVDVQDDHGSAQADSSAATRLAGPDRAFAVLQATGVLDTTYLSQHGVGVFGWNLTQGACAEPGVFGVTGCNDSADGQGVSAANVAQLARVALARSEGAGVTVATDSGQPPGATAQCRRPFTAGGLFPRPAVLPPPGASGYVKAIGALLRPVRGAAPAMVFACSPSDSAQQLDETLNYVGYGGVRANGSLYDTGLSKNPLLSGMFVTLQWAPYQSETPAVTQMVADIGSVAPAQALNLGVAAGYLSADMAVAALQRMGADPSASKLRALGSGFSWSDPGLACPVHLPEASRTSNGAAATVRLVAGEYQVAAPLACPA